MKLKDFKIDLGGSFPSKSEAVQRHAFELGWEWGFSKREPVYTKELFLFFNKEGKITYGENFSFFKNQHHYNAITTEKFLELTKKDVIEKEPVFYYRYRIWFRDGEVRETEYFCNMGNDIIECLSGKRHMMISDMLKFERIGEGVAKVSG
jgi:hypothetical protein